MADDATPVQQAEPEGTPPPVPPRLGAAATGALSALFASALVLHPLFGLIIAPLGIVPVARFLASGRRAIGDDALDLVHTFTFEARDDGGTKVSLVLHGAGQIDDEGIDALDRVWDHFLERYRAHAEGELSD